MFPLTTEIPRSSLGLPRRLEQHYGKLHRRGKLCFYVFCTVHCDSYVILLTSKTRFLN